MLSPVAAVSRWLLLLLSRLLSADVYPSFPAGVHSASAPGTFRPGCGRCAPPLPPIGLTAAALFAGGEVSRADSRTLTRQFHLCSLPMGAARSALDTVPEAYHNPAAVWWGAFAFSAVIGDQVVHCQSGRWSPRPAAPVAG